MTKRYRVTGSTRTLGHDPGSTFEADIPAEQEQRLIARGSIELAPKADKGRTEQPPARTSKTMQQGDE